MAEHHQLPSYIKTTTTTPATTRVFHELNNLAEQRANDCERATMPSMDHIDWKDYDRVYPPSDDTFLLLDAIQLSCQQSATKDKMQSIQPLTALEIGCGTGIPITFLGLQFKQHLQRQEHHYYDPIQLFATDINAHALRVTNDTAKAHTLDLQTYQCDLASALLSSSPASSTLYDYPSAQHALDHAVDIILFNPPYVPTPDDEVVELHPMPTSQSSSDVHHPDHDVLVHQPFVDVGIEASWAGGHNGRRVIDRAIPQIAQLLRKPNGVAFMITVDDNLPEQLAEELPQQRGLRMEPLLRRRARNEYLTVQRISWI